MPLTTRKIPTTPMMAEMSCRRREGPVMHPRHDRLRLRRCEKATGERYLGKREHHDLVNDHRGDLRTGVGARCQDGGERGDVL